VNSSQTVAASYRYDPFGNTTASSGTLAAANTCRFSSKEVNVNSGLYYYGYRFYSPNLQRWLNSDPLLERGFQLLDRVFVSELHLLRLPVNVKWRFENTFMFVGNKPISSLDNFGLTGCPIWPPKPDYCKDQKVLNACVAATVVGCSPCLMLPTHLIGRALCAALCAPLIMHCCCCCGGCAI